MLHQELFALWRLQLTRASKVKSKVGVATLDIIPIMSRDYTNSRQQRQRDGQGPGRAAYGRTLQQP